MPFYGLQAGDYAHARIVYGADDRSDETVGTLSEKHVQLYAHGPLYELLHEKLHIKKVMLDAFIGTPFEADTRIFARIWQPSDYVRGGARFRRVGRRDGGRNTA